MIEPTSLETAYARHQQSVGYTVVVGDLKRPHCFLQVGATCLVCYFDELCRPHVSHDFIEVEGQADRLFLASVIHREYNLNSRDVIRGRTFTFAPDGNVRIIEHDLAQKMEKIADAHADVTDYFVKRPGFGEYTEFIRMRTIKLIN